MTGGLTRTCEKSARARCHPSGPDTFRGRRGPAVNGLRFLAGDSDGRAGGQGAPFVKAVEVEDLSWLLVLIRGVYRLG